MEVSEEKKLEYKKIAIDTVIKYAKEQGVKLRHSDFQISNDKRYTGNYAVFFSHEQPIVVVYIDNEGRWAAQLKKARDGFLNYLNARVMKNGVQFSFTTRELDLLRVKNEDTGTDKDVDIEKIISKVAKLLALSDLEKNPSENEAISASLAAQKLLAKYNLTMADVTGGHDPAEEIEQVVADVGTGKKWKYELAEAVAENYACKVFSRGAEMIIFYGYKADVLIARRVFIYLFKVGNRLANQYVKNYRENVWYDASGVYNSFVSGFTNGVRKELEKQCTALALVIQPEVQETWKIFSAAMKKVDWSIESNNQYAYQEGFVEGKRALNAQYLEGEADA